MLTTAIIFIILLSILVFVHELGHFYTARKFGVKTSEFGFGFPPRAFGFKKVNGKRKFFWGSADAEEIKSEDTIYSLNWIPVGGFVNIKGENGENRNEPDSFGSKAIWKRVVILSAGVTMNVVLCTVCLIIALMIGAPEVLDSNSSVSATDRKIQVISVLKDSVAEKAGFKSGDAFVSIDGATVVSVEAVQSAFGAKENIKTTVVMDRAGEIKTFEVEPKLLSENGKPGIGVALAATGVVSYPWYQAIWLGIKGTWLMFAQIIVAFATVIKSLFVGGGVSADLAGPIGIAAMTGQVARMGFVYVLQFAALLSMNLAIINFLPFPALDGGRVLFLVIEKIRGKAVNQKIEQWIHASGFAILMILIVVVTGRDIFKFRDFFINIWEKVVS